MCKCVFASRREATALLLSGTPSLRNKLTPIMLTILSQNLSVRSEFFGAKTHDVLIYS